MSGGVETVADVIRREVREAGEAGLTQSRKAAKEDGARSEAEIINRFLDEVDDGDLQAEIHSNWSSTEFAERALNFLRGFASLREENRVSTRSTRTEEENAFFETGLRQGSAPPQDERGFETAGASTGSAARFPQDERLYGLTDAPGGGPAKQASDGTPLEPTASPALAGGAFSAEDVALIHALRAGSGRVVVWPGNERPVLLKDRPDAYGQQMLDHLTGPEALALGLALVRAAMAVQP